MTEQENGRPAGGRAAESDTGSASTSTIAEVADITVYQRRRACRRAHAHLAAHGLDSEVVRRVLADIAAGVGA